MEAVRQNGLALECVSYDFQNNIYVVLEAVRQNGHALRYASYNLRINKQVILSACNQNKYAIFDVFDTLVNSDEELKEIKRQVIKNDTLLSNLNPIP